MDNNTYIVFICIDDGVSNGGVYYTKEEAEAFCAKWNAENNVGYAYYVTVENK